MSHGTSRLAGSSSSGAGRSRLAPYGDVNHRTSRPPLRKSPEARRTRSIHFNLRVLRPFVCFARAEGNSWTVSGTEVHLEPMILARLIPRASSIILSLSRRASMFVLPPPHVEKTAANAAVAPGRGHLEFVHNGARTVVTRAYATSPLRLLTPANHGRAAWVYTSTLGGGFVDGDQMTIDVDVKPGAAALLSTQASTKVYRSPRGTAMGIDAHVDDGVLFVLPDPVVPFAGARYRQEQRFSVSPGGSLLVLDALLAGRCASGERWRFLEYSSLLKITVGDRLIVHDALALRAADGNMMRRFGRFTALATVAIIGRAFRDDIERLLMWSAGQNAGRRPDQLVTVAPVSDEGCLVRIIGTSGEKVSQTVRALLDFVPRRLGDDPWSRRW